MVLIHFPPCLFNYFFVMEKYLKKFNENILQHIQEMFVSRYKKRKGFGVGLKINRASGVGNGISSGTSANNFNCGSENGSGYGYDHTYLQEAGNIRGTFKGSEGFYFGRGTGCGFGLITGNSLDQTT